jgi:hypothetical protein
MSRTDKEKIKLMVFGYKVILIGLIICSLLVFTTCGLVHCNVITDLVRDLILIGGFTSFGAVCYQISITHYLENKNV